MRDKEQLWYSANTYPFILSLSKDALFNQRSVHPSTGLRTNGCSSFIQKLSSSKSQGEGESQSFLLDFIVSPLEWFNSYIEPTLFNILFPIIMVGVLMLLVTSASAHELRPAYLEINEVKPNRFELFWKVPQRGGLRLSLNLVLPGNCHDTVPAQQYVLSDAVVERRTVACGESGLINGRIAITGLQTTMTDVLVRVSLMDGAVTTTLVRPNKPWVEISGAQSIMEVAREYPVLGIEHILLGVDHLLFVLGLLLIVRNIGLLLKTITAFTVAHSITLALATLGFVSVPQPPVEATIALSILFLASELEKMNRGKTGLTMQYPWVVSFSFGLLHGLGFAGALADVGLPKSDIPLALFTFNVGVEAGQLLFVSAVLVLIVLLKRLPLGWPAWVQRVPPYVIGSLAAFWFIQRIAGF